MLASALDPSVGWQFDLLVLPAVVLVLMLAWPWPSRSQAGESLGEGFVDYRNPEQDELVMRVYDWESEGL